MANDQKVAAGPIVFLTGTKNSIPRNAKPPLNPPKKLKDVKKYINTQTRCPTNKLKSVKFAYCFEKHVVFYL